MTAQLHLPCCKAPDRCCLQRCFCRIQVAEPRYQLAASDLPVDVLLTCSCSSSVGIMRAASRDKRGKSVMDGAGPSSGMAGVDREDFRPGPRAAWFGSCWGESML